ncbi:MAG: peptidoglycan DD-metalloendopeptidase family protein [Gammaproteobacteria bacterium]|nr:peptidoglycan DD-metalloendopeptidase family protein [Gammaproteobacteria bacterium]
MKRNRLNPSSSRKSLFSDTASRLNSRRNVFVLSSLAIASVFITSIVLATNRPSTSTVQSQVIGLPNLSAEIQNTSGSNLNSRSVNTIVLPTPATSDAQATTIDNEATKNKIAKTVEQAPANLHLDELTELEQQAALATITHNNLIETANIEAEINWQELTVKSGDNLSLIFPRVGLSARDVYNVAKLGKDIKPLLNLKPGQTIRFNIKEKNGTKYLQQLQLKLNPIKTFSVTSLNDSYQAELQTRDVEQRQMHASAQIKSSLFEAGIEAGLSDKLIMELAYIFGWDIDFALDLRKGDDFTLIYAEDYLDGDKIADGAILAAEFTNQGKIFRAIRYTDKNGRSQYYSPKGDSMRKAFSRTPVHFSRISSKFNPNRKHPVLKTSRPHRGVDYAAARGTPILATGDGKISFRGTKGGYGRTVVLTHGGKYTTLYAHMSKFKKGLRNGSRVKQGQTIGYIGSSGLATGPHLHYEFRVNGVHRNPLTVSLPKADALAKKYRPDFDLKSQPLLAQLDSLTNTNLALND